MRWCSGLGSAVWVPGGPVLPSQPPEQRSEGTQCTGSSVGLCRGHSHCVAAGLPAGCSGSSGQAAATHAPSGTHGPPLLELPEWPVRPCDFSPLGHCTLTPRAGWTRPESPAQAGGLQVEMFGATSHGVAMNPALGRLKQEDRKFQTTHSKILSQKKKSQPCLVAHACSLSVYRGWARGLQTESLSGESEPAARLSGNRLASIPRVTEQGGQRLGGTIGPGTCRLVLSAVT